ncbi:hypothetical protein V6239_14720 [Vibrio alginolyticus]|uniref:hypothetical protein n=1 Tax=Vibrio TaxID=662 RepID=UPI00296451D9|nr:hypothetical protein [Vibrio sp. YT-18]MDW1549201.1 hypothetical protein [Vibrio sp. YT-18]
MVKNESFGTASVKYPSKAITLCLLLFGCASVLDSETAEKQWQERFDYCEEIANENRITIPNSLWFDSLSDDDKKTTIGYLANYTDRMCMKDATAKLKKSLVAEDNQEKLNYYSVDLTPLDKLASDRVKHLDEKELTQLAERMNQPFNLRYALQDKGLYPDM